MLFVNSKLQDGQINLQDAGDVPYHSDSRVEDFICFQLLEGQVYPAG
jgi:hypothetical protein